jgi:nucleoside-diphosphate-sugar epimerase
VKTFVAGATGVLGRRVVLLLTNAGYDVTAVARSDARATLLRELGARPVTIDVFDPAAVRQAVAGHEVVCNLATHIPSPIRMAMPGAWAENDRIRIEVSRNLVDAVLAGGAQRYVQESIAFLYRDAHDEWIDESSPIDPVANIRSATVAESNAARVTAAGAIGVVLRFAAFYGPESDATLDMIRLAKRRIAIGAGPKGYMSSITTDDAASAVVASLSVPAGLYNISDDEPVTRREFFGALAGALGVRPPFVPPAAVARLGGAKASILTRSQRISNRRFVEATGWKPTSRSVYEGWPTVIAAAGTAGTDGHGGRI